MEDINRATFSTAPASSDCMIFVINLFYQANNHWLNDYYGHSPLIYNVVYAKGVFYCAFSAHKVMGAYNPALHEWKLHPYPPSLDDGNLILLSYKYNNPDWVFKFDLSQMKWFRIENFMSGQSNGDLEQVEVENLNNRILFYTGEASKLANTIHSTPFRWDRRCTSRGGKGCTHQSSCPQIYDWVDGEADSLWKFWIQPPQTR
ncbi:hypothetical protein ACOSP7_019648 [Xanthoceras sorbifolium]